MFAPGSGLLYCNWVMRVAVLVCSISSFLLGSAVLEIAVGPATWDIKDIRKALRGTSHITLNDTRFMDPSARLNYEGTRNRRRGHRNALLSTFTFPGASNSCNASSLDLSRLKCVHDTSMRSCVL